MAPALLAQLGLGIGQLGLGALTSAFSKRPDESLLQKNIQDYEQAAGNARSRAYKGQNRALYGFENPQMAAMLTASRNAGNLTAANLRSGAGSRGSYMANLAAANQKAADGTADVYAKSSAVQNQKQQYADTLGETADSAQRQIAEQRKYLDAVRRQIDMQKRAAGAGMMGAGIQQLGNMAKFQLQQGANQKYFDYIKGLNDRTLSNAQGGGGTYGEGYYETSPGVGGYAEPSTMATGTQSMIPTEGGEGGGNPNMSGRGDDVNQFGGVDKTAVNPLNYPDTQGGGEYSPLSPKYLQQLTDRELSRSLEEGGMQNLPEFNPLGQPNLTGLGYPYQNNLGYGYPNNFPVAPTDRYTMPQYALGGLVRRDGDPKKRRKKKEPIGDEIRVDEETGEFVDMDDVRGFFRDERLRKNDLFREKGNYFEDFTPEELEKYFQETGEGDTQARKGGKMPARYPVYRKGGKYALGGLVRRMEKGGLAEEGGDPERENAQGKLRFIQNMTEGQREVHPDDKDWKFVQLSEATQNAPARYRGIQESTGEQYDNFYTKYVKPPPTEEMSIPVNKSVKEVDFHSAPHSEPEYFQTERKKYLKEKAARLSSENPTMMPYIGEGLFYIPKKGERPKLALNEISQKIAIDGGAYPNVGITNENKTNPHSFYFSSSRYNSDRNGVYERIIKKVAPDLPEEIFHDITLAEHKVPYPQVMEILKEKYTAAQIKAAYKANDKTIEEMKKYLKSAEYEKYKRELRRYAEGGKVVDDYDDDDDEETIVAKMSAMQKRLAQLRGGQSVEDVENDDEDLETAPPQDDEDLETPVQNTDEDDEDKMAWGGRIAKTRIKKAAKTPKVKQSKLKLTLPKEPAETDLDAEIVKAKTVSRKPKKEEKNGLDPLDLSDFTDLDVADSYARRKGIDSFRHGGKVHETKKVS